ncbi:MULTISPECIES: hypothetical protein [unclassified Vibrio]|uniref:hypothetical protein n=1 Tax=unclassified Vibrio TaxID=2614977 RepID=UPI00159E3DDA|nr:MULTISPECIES: hypothetical protein [unclassified Vibrio]NVN83239.1 hypothetical protein [Vibrio sp. Scap16]QLE91610.1 hypothetical protein FLM53_00310 [Vibrio sp. Scap24]
MDEVFVHTEGTVLKIMDKVRILLSNIDNDEQPKNVKSAAQTYQKVLTEYSNASQFNKANSSVELTLKLIHSAQTLAIGVTYLSDLPIELIENANEIISLCIYVREVMQPKNVHDAEDLLAKFEDRLLKVQEDNSRYDRHIKASFAQNEARMDDLKEKSDKLATSIYEQTEKINEFYADAITEIDSKKEQIDGILGHVSGRAISGDYESNSSEEKKIANRLRYGSLLCMLFIVLIVAYSFWETTQASFQWEQSIFRVALAAILSVPAAYLARESAKHREQQYSHLQTSLNLKTLSPYIASLPEPEQHRIKAEVAQRLFSSKDFSRVTDDSYPLNTHELIMELLKKIDPKK